MKIGYFLSSEEYTPVELIEQAAATSAVLLNGRFRLGVGTGEALNEHVLGSVWPSVDVRLEMLEEAVEIMRRLWTEDGFVNHRGKHYIVDIARIYTRPDEPLPIYLSGFGPQATDVAARIADGHLTRSPDPELLQRFREHGGGDKPAQAGFKVSYAPTAEEGVEQAHRIWANSGEHEASTVVDVAPNIVFERLSDLRNLPGYIPWLTSLHPTAVPVSAQGAEVRSPHEAVHEEVDVTVGGGHREGWIDLIDEELDRTLTTIKTMLEMEPS